MMMHRQNRLIRVFLAEVSREDLGIYTVCVMAKRDLEQGQLASALARLKVDADKLCYHDTPLNDLLPLAEADNHTMGRLPVDDLLDAYGDKVPRDYFQPDWSERSDEFDWKRHLWPKLREIWPTFSPTHRRQIAEAAQRQADAAAQTQIPD